MTRPIDTLLFDFDGTIFDTAPDIIDALNHVLQSHGRPTVALETLRSRINGGSIALLGHGFNIDEHHPDFEKLKAELLAHYGTIRNFKARYFDGMETVLEYLNQKQIPWGIVTNRLSTLAQPLLDNHPTSGKPHCLIGSDMVKNIKPHPESLLQACQLMKIEPHQALYIGDSRSDIEAAHAAGMSSMLALYGYIGEYENPEEWNAHYYVRNPIEIIDWIEKTF